MAEGAITIADVNLENVGLLADSFHMFKENENLRNREGKLWHTQKLQLMVEYPVQSDDLLEAFFKELKAINI